MNKSEAKFFNTSNKMNKAFLKLLEKKEFKDISIIEICNEAGVNRSTFYAHYDNTYDLLQETHSNLIKKFFDDINQTIDVIDIQKASADELIFITPQYLIPYLRFVKNNKFIYKVYNNSNAFATNETDKLLIENIFMPIYEKNGVKDKTIVNYMSKYFLSGINAITMEWVQRDCVDDILLICEIISICVRPAMKFTKD
ncbi:MAG: TetR/AcrR family transcriptional regulator [Erysipelotrichales bacterium]|nr:TetR/AcrR family transcriptional regulator [Erysipelotrichales bacterium]